MRLVFSLGGSILAPETVDEKYVREAAGFLKRLSARNQVAVVVGGGRPARERIKAARERGASWAECDHEGILATRENARALVKALGADAEKTVPETVREAAVLYGKRIVVMGGTEPGHSTDAVAALIGDWVKADVFVNASNVDAVYDKDPKKNHGAKPLERVGIDELIRLLDGEGFNAGEYPLLDHVALKVIKRARLKTVILDGRDLANMEAAAEGRKFRGTVVVP